VSTGKKNETKQKIQKKAVYNNNNNNNNNNNFNSSTAVRPIIIQ
jgi:hypothetical protein